MEGLVAGEVPNATSVDKWKFPTIQLMKEI